MNHVHLLGRLTADPIISTTANNHTKATFTLAVDRAKGDDCDFLYCTAWDKSATFAENWLKKGERVVLFGSIRTHSFTDASGNKRTAYDIIADRLYFADSPKKETLDEFENVF